MTTLGDARKLARTLKDAGWIIVKGTKHTRAFAPDGGGSIIIPKNKTNGRGRNRRNDAALLKKYGIDL